ncbi:MAG TPA: ATP-binding protein [Nostoc sp.]|uniref:ATP-binding protein n=1 Tax=Nostoc sp. TaxID=1180 RepID=UPI002D34DAEF|nr:ATP-binding protein [Nostoc sp.]HYX19055.1 ATP-binding protein [Nostoc sp.]
MEKEKITIDLPSHRIERQAWVEMPLPDWRALARFSGWASGRILFGLGIFTISTTKAALKILVYCCEQLEAGTKKLIIIYDALPLMGVPLQSVVAEIQPKSALPQDLQTIDLLEAIDGKHIFIIGDTGTGKSSLAQWLAYRLGGEVTVYDPDASPDEWQGLKVIGRKGNFEAIQEAMEADLEELQRRIELRGESGDKALVGLESTTIAEEFPLLASEVDIASDWLIKHGNRGRKPKRCIIALSQTDAVKSLGIEGEGQARKNFRYVRLGKFAVDHAKKLGDVSLEAWLKTGKYRCMVDDQPCQLPDTKQYGQVMSRLQPVTPEANAVTPETVALQGFAAGVTAKNGLSEDMIKAVKACLGAGLSDSKIVKEVMGYQGGQFTKGQEILKQIKKP